MPCAFRQPAVRLRVAAAVVALSANGVACGGAVVDGDGASMGGAAGTFGGNGAGGSAVGSGGAGGSGGSTGRDAGGRRDGARPDPIDEPECPDVPKPDPILQCDLFAPAPGGCAFGEVCYPGSMDGANECEPSTFVSYCREPGSGVQDVPCENGGDCAEGYFCVGSPYRCKHRCGPSEQCPDGLICEGVVGFEGVGACQ